eukprot:TRINITY_DN39209_c0_g1_i2.p1 TRINITY_DN39209_c0_g1~~TRINITY_DN39209_c0_g1_i2.p1  ORF type:complete len:340 (+),score=6.40 TRINITY_DN39209_c0_g1_i2:135-1154(+)
MFAVPAHLATVLVSLSVSLAEFVEPQPLGPDGAYPGCPCRASSTSLTSSQDGSTRRTTSGWLVPDNYGLGACRPWDNRSIYDDLGDPHCKSVKNRPNRCDAMWCFVNESACDREHHQSNELDGMFYSYVTCGNIFLADSLSLERKSVRVGQPGGKTVTSHSDTDDQLERFSIRLAAKVLSDLGASEADLIHTAPSKEALAMKARGETSSDFTVCVMDVAIGNIDLCVGDFWDTPERRSLGAYYTSSYLVEEMFLYGRTEESSFDLIRSLWAPMAPFSGRLWIMLLVTSALMGCAIVVVEGEGSEEHGVIRRCWYTLRKGAYGALPFVGVPLAPVLESRA